MSDPRDTRDFDGDARVDAAWRSVSREEPPARLDDAILATAREAVLTDPPGRADRPRAAWWQRWQPLAAAAGVAGLALVLAQRLPTDAPSERAAPAPAAESTQSESRSVVAPEASPAAPVPPPDATTNATASRPALEQQAPSAKGSGQRLESAPTPAFADAPPPAAAPVAEASRSAAAGPAAGSTADAAESREGSAPDAWAARILELHASGQLDRAAEELRAFRKAYPDADSYLSQELRPWAATGDDPAPE